MTSEVKKYGIKDLVLPVYLPSLLYSIGEAGLLPIIPASAEKLGADIPTAGVIAGLVMLGTLVADIPAARLVNRFGERTSMISAAFIAAIGVLLAVFATNIYLLGAGVLILGATVAVFALARHSFIAEHVPMSHRARSLSLLGGMFRGGAFIGPLIGAGIVAAFGVQNVYWMTVIFCGLAGLLLLVTTKADDELPKKEAAQTGVWSVVIAERRKFFTAGLAASTLGIVRASRTIGLPLWALYIGLDPALTALYIGIAGALDFALFYSSGQIMDKFGRRWAAIPTLIGMGITHMMVGLALDAPMFLTVALLMSVANGIGSGVILVIGADLAPASHRNEFLSAYRLMIDAGVAATPPMIAILTLFFGLAASMTVIGSIGLVGAAVLWRWLPKFGIR